MPQFTLGLDLGQSRDRSALAVLETVPDGAEPRFHLRHLARYPRGLSYPDLVHRVVQFCRRPALGGQPALVVDKTGVGAPVFDLLVRAGLCPFAALLHGGDRFTRQDRELRIPVRDLIANLQVLLQSRRLALAAALPGLDDLLRELAAFRCALSPQGRDSYGAPAGAHDDLVFSLALAAFGAHRVLPPEPFVYLSVEKRLFPRTRGLW